MCESVAFHPMKEIAEAMHARLKLAFSRKQSQMGVESEELCHDLDQQIFLLSANIYQQGRKDDYFWLNILP